MPHSEGAARYYFYQLHTKGLVKRDTVLLLVHFDMGVGEDWVTAALFSHVKPTNNLKFCVEVSQEGTFMITWILALVL